MPDNVSFLTAPERELFRQQEVSLDKLRAAYLSQILLAQAARKRMARSPEAVQEFERINQVEYNEFMRSFPIPPQDGLSFNFNEIGAFSALALFEQECRAQELASALIKEHQDL